MYRTISYENKNNESIEISIYPPFLLTDFIEEGDVDVYNSKGILQNGSTYLNNTLNVKDISIEFVIKANTKEDLINYRKEINKTFNPQLGEGVLSYKDQIKTWTVNCIINNLPVFKRINDSTFKCLISITAHNPFWNDKYEVGEEISTWIGGWKFKFKLPFRFKQRGESKKNIVNEGHVETPVEIIFKGPALNPCVINNSTSEFIKITRELTSDDILYITTEYGNKKVEIERNGVRSNAFNYIDLDSTFFQLKVGDNMLEYTTDNNLEPQSVEIRYKNRYLGV